MGNPTDQRPRLLRVPAPGVVSLLRREGGSTAASVNIGGLNMRRYPDNRTCLVVTREPDPLGTMRVLVVQDGKPWGGYVFDHPLMGKRIGVLALRPDGTLRIAGIASPESHTAEVFFAGGAGDLTGWSEFWNPGGNAGPPFRTCWHTRSAGIDTHITITGIVAPSTDGIAFRQDWNETAFPPNAVSMFQLLVAAAKQLGEMFTAVSGCLSGGGEPDGVIGEGVVTHPSVPGRTVVREGSALFDGSGASGIPAAVLDAAVQPSLKLVGKFGGDPGAVALVQPPALITVGTPPDRAPFVLFKTADEDGFRVTTIQIPVVPLGTVVFKAVAKGDDRAPNASMAWHLPGSEKPLWEVAHPGFKSGEHDPTFRIEDLLLLIRGPSGSYSLGTSGGNVPADWLA